MPGGAVGISPDVRRLRNVEDILPNIYRLPRHAPRLKILALHAGLTTDEQLAVFEPAERGTRKVIVSTNIAEVCLPILLSFTFFNRIPG